MQRLPSIPPLKIKGKRAYDLARAGRPVELAPRMVRIDRIDAGRVLLASPRAGDRLRRRELTSARLRDVGEALGCGGLVETLVRTRIGPFTLERRSIRGNSRP